ncbi:tRNA pseudouridine(38-40) synthase TruA [Nannocystis bainbridge]|uniref:tRNA pseudouridine synthase A n=1 Tax=Nannocystis bainbridge TaxID=2995303 RepID=A0ABT5DS61_9BACT|nr:tRNA pseudouridine(38-40) synthase TruA [Nannocystis bainbridge]MDC0715563.1 tRNA pseudouridine(38-40) synthase TruA [Nannocystis bainbridge]
MTLLLRVAYDGTDFHGFARQEGIRTVQGALEAALSELYRGPTRTRAASRTDAGVHALGQLVGFEPTLPIPARGVVLGLTSKLPRDVGVLGAWACELPDGRAVDPRFFNDGKTYRYRIRCTPHRVPTTDRGEWHLTRPLDVAAMQAAAAAFVGEHDFAGFRASMCQAPTTVRKMLAVEVAAAAAEEPAALSTVAARDVPAVVTVTVRGEAFLQNMVRIMVGTLVEVGLGRRPPAQIAELLARPDRSRSGRTAPPQGLTLVEVHWPEPWPPDDWQTRARPPDDPPQPPADLV